MMHNSDEIMNSALSYFYGFGCTAASTKTIANENVIHMRNENINKNLFPCYSMIRKIFCKTEKMCWNDVSK